LVEETGAKDHGTYLSLRLGPNPEERSPANPPWTLSKGDGDSRHRAQRSPGLPTEVKTRASLLFHISRGEAEDPGQVLSGLVVHPSETSGTRQALRRANATIGSWMLWLSVPAASEASSPRC
jgi:hypothetical protein